jgi:hypothetical protein
MGMRWETGGRRLPKAALRALRWLMGGYPRWPGWRDAPDAAEEAYAEQRRAERERALRAAHEAALAGWRGRGEPWRW